MKRILITGGAGFLGTHTIVDNFSTSVVDSDDDIFDGHELIIADILELNWDELGKFDTILHLASPVGPSGILKHSGVIAQYILNDIYWAIEGAKKNDCPLIFVSTSEIYGYRESAILLKEEDDKILTGNFKVRNEYSCAKLLAEIVLSNTAKVCDLKYQIIRPFNISGKRQLINGGFVLPTFVTQALAGTDITVFGTGDQIRAFTHVEDIIDGVFLTSTTDKMNEIWNIGNADNITSIVELADIVKSKTASKSDITFVDPKTIHGPLYEEAWDKIPDATKIKDLLGWSPKQNISEICDDVIAYYAG